MATEVIIKGNELNTLGTLERNLISAINNAMKMYKMTGDKDYSNMVNSLSNIKRQIQVEYALSTNRELEKIDKEYE